MSDDRPQNPGSQGASGRNEGDGSPDQPSHPLSKGDDATRPDPAYGYGPPTYGDPTAPSSQPYSSAGGTAPSYGSGDAPSYGGGTPSYGSDTPSYGGDTPSYGGDTTSYGAAPSYGADSSSSSSTPYGGYQAPQQTGYGEQSSPQGTYAGAAAGGAAGAYGAGTYGAPGAPGGPYGQPPAKKKSRTGLLVGLIAVGLVVVIGIVVGIVALASSGGGKPSETVQAYLQALSEGNAEKALEQGEKPADTTFATSEALKSQQESAKISAIEVSDGYSSGSRARVSATYKFGNKQADESFSLTKIGGEWKLDDTVYPITLSSLGDVPGLTLLGIETEGKDKAYVFPGPLTWGSSNEYITVTERDADDFTLSPSDGTFSFSTLETGLSDAGEKAVAEAVTTYITACAKSKSLEPDGCSQAEYDYEAVEGTAVWTAPDDLSSLEYRTSSPVTEVYVSGDLTWSVKYSAKDYDGKVTTKTVTDVDGSLYGQVDLSKSPPVYSE